MGGTSIWHILLVGGIILIFFGPSRLPGLGKSVGEAIRGFKKGLDGDEIDVTDASKQKRDNLPPSDGSAQAQSQSEKDKTKS